MILRRRKRHSLGLWRRRLLRETEAALIFGLLHPERAPRIPTVLVGMAEFDSHWASRWWNQVLELDGKS